MNSKQEKSLSSEVWLDVVGFKGLYKVSNHGRVRSLSRLNRIGGGYFAWRRGKFMKGTPTGKYKHLLVMLRDGKGGHCGRYIHRLVLEAFVGPCPPDMEACHFTDKY